MEINKRFHSLKLKHLLGLSFGVLLVILFALGVISTQYIRSISASTETLYNRPHTNLVGMWTAKSKISQTGNGLREEILYGTSLSAELSANFTGVETLLRDIEGNKVDKNAPMSDNMKQILEAVALWGQEGQKVHTSIAGGKKPSKAEMDAYTQAEQDAITKVDSIIATASENALKFKNSAMKNADSSLVVLLLIFAGALTATILLLGVLVKRILSPIHLLLDSAQRIAQGNLDSEITYVSGDEFGNLADSFRQMQTFLKNVIADERENLVRMGNKDFQVETRADYHGDFSVIKDSLHIISSHLSSTLSKINESADQVAQGSDQVAAGAQLLSQGATEQASSVEELAATIDEISKQVKQNAGHSQKARETVMGVEEHVKESSQRMEDMLAAISEISGSSQEIGKIIKTIEDIAFQTNILALNAAVEAARAGEAGKGFAVVADEVRNLAGKSAEASKNTAELIESSLLSVENGTKIAGETAQALEQVVSGVHTVAETIQEISTASDSQASSLEQVTQGIDQIASVVQTTSGTAEESAAASSELSGQAKTLKDLVGQFRLRDSGNEI